MLEGAQMKPTMQWLWKHPFILLVIIGLGFYTYNKVHTYFARMYFDSHCENDAGEFIYKTVENVKGLYQMRLRDPYDRIDNLRYYFDGTGELHEDPYGHTNWESQQPEVIFVRPSKRNYKYLETTKKPNIDDARYPKTILSHDIVDKSEKYWIYQFGGIGGKHDTRARYSVVNSHQLKSRYGFTWREKRSVLDRFFGVWGSELIVKDLSNDETLAVRKGYLAFGIGACPPRAEGDYKYEFISKVLKPVKED